MKWLPTWGRVQMSACGRYTVQHPNDDGVFIAYSIPTYGKPAKLGEFKSDAEARTRCEDDERELLALRKAS